MKFVTEEVELSYILPRGSLTEYEHCLPEQGHQYLNYEIGDVILRFIELDHPVFKRIGPDLYLHHKITLIEAFTGFNFTFIHLDGRRI